MRCFGSELPSQVIGIEYDNSSVGEEEKFSMQHVKSAVLDWQVRGMRCYSVSTLIDLP